MWKHVAVALALAACASKKEAPVSTERGSDVVAAPAPTERMTTFWAWFVTNAEALRTEKDLRKVMEAITAELAKATPGVFAEIGGDNDARTLVLSVNGKKELFPVVQALYAARPTVKGWAIVAFRQRAAAGSPALQIAIGDVTVDPAGVKIKAVRAGPKIEVDVFLPGNMTDDQRAQIGFLLLDHVVGEYDMETKVGGLSFNPIGKAPSDAVPLTSLPALVDAIP